jgi:hypothetical protein
MDDTRMTIASNAGTAIKFFPLTSITMILQSSPKYIKRENREQSVATCGDVMRAFAKEMHQTRKNAIKLFPPS